MSTTCHLPLWLSMEKIIQYMDTYRAILFRWRKVSREAFLTLLIVKSCLKLNIYLYIIFSRKKKPLPNPPPAPTYVLSLTHTNEPIRENIFKKKCRQKANSLQKNESIFTIQSVIHRFSFSLGYVSPNRYGPSFRRDGSYAVKVIHDTRDAVATGTCACVGEIYGGK